MLTVDLENELTGENLALYQNIEDLKKLVTKAKTLIAKSHTVSNDIICDKLLNDTVRGADVGDENNSLKSLQGECSHCGLHHGAYDFCILHEILSEEKVRRDTTGAALAAKRKEEEKVVYYKDSPVSGTYFAEDSEIEAAASEAKVPLATPPRKQPSQQKKVEWENLLYRQMSPEEQEVEYSKIRYRYGTAAGEKFLYARSMARGPDPVEPLFCQNWEDREKERPKGKTKIASIVKRCVSEKTRYLPELCPEFSPEVSQKMATVRDVDLPCEVNTPKYNKTWKDIFKPNNQETIEGGSHESLSLPYLSSRVTRGPKLPRGSGYCTCGLDECHCGKHPPCSPPVTNCLKLMNEAHNNYLITIREKMQNRRQLFGKTKKEFHHIVVRPSPSVRTSHDFLRRDSEMMLNKSKELHYKELKDCIMTAIGVSGGDLKALDQGEMEENVKQITEITSAFNLPDERAWDKWIERFNAQDAAEEQRSVSADSIFPTSTSSCTISTTDQELIDPWPPQMIPFVEEPYKLVDILYSKILARFRKSILKSTMKCKFNAYKKNMFFYQFDKLMPYEHTQVIRRELFNKLNLRCLYLKSFKPNEVIKAGRVKKLNLKSKTLSRTIKRRNYIQSIQLGQCYRLRKKSMDFTKEKDFVGCKAKDRNLLQKPASERFAACDLVGDGCGALLSQEKIHYHYRLLRTLFHGSMESADRESLMDEGMRERLQNYKNTRLSNSWSPFEDQYDLDDNGMELLKAASFPTRSPSKRDEKRLKSAPGHIPSRTKADHGSHRLSSRLADYGKKGESKCQKPSHMTSTQTRCNYLEDELSPSTLASDGTTAYSNRWNRYGYPPTRLLEGSLAKTIINSSQRASSENAAHPTNQKCTVSTSFNKSPEVIQDSSDSYVQWGPYRLPSPPLSESGSDELDSVSYQHRIPRKEEAHIETSARIDLKTTEYQMGENISNPELRSREWKTVCKFDEPEHDDRSSDSYVPDLLKIPPKTTSRSPVNFNKDWGKSSGSARHKSRHRTRASASYLSDSSSTDAESVSPKRCKERQAWDHKSGLRNIAPYLDTHLSTLKDVNYNSSARPNVETGQKIKSNYMSPLPKAGRSILKNSTLPKLPKPPRGDTQETPKKTLRIDPIRHQFSDSSCRTISWPSNGRIRPAGIITERLLKAPQGDADDNVATSSRKYSSLSRATPDVAPSSTLPEAKKSIDSRDMVFNVPLPGSKKSTEARVDSLSSPQQPQTEGSIDNTRTSRPSITRKSSKADLVDKEQPPQQRTSLGVAAKRMSKVSEVFRHRSLVQTDPEADRKELQKKVKSKKGDGTSQSASETSMQVKLKKLAAIGPTNKKSFNLDIGQGINCVNYLKENAPGADEVKKKDLVDLLCTPVEVKRTAKKMEKEASMDSFCVKSMRSINDSTSTSVFSPNTSAKVKVQSHVERADESPLTKRNFKTLDQIYKEVHGINERNTPRRLVENDYEYEAKKKQQLAKHRISP